MRTEKNWVGREGGAAIQDKNNESRSRRFASHGQDHSDPRQTSVFACQGYIAEILNPGLTSTATQTMLINNLSPTNP